MRASEWRFYDYRPAAGEIPSKSKACCRKAAEVARMVAPPFHAMARTRIFLILAEERLVILLARLQRSDRRRERRPAGRPKKEFWT